MRVLRQIEFHCNLILFFSALDYFTSRYIRNRTQSHTLMCTFSQIDTDTNSHTKRKTTGNFSINMRLQSYTVHRKSFIRKAEHRFEPNLLTLALTSAVSFTLSLYLTRSFHLAHFHFQIDLCILTFNVVSIYLIDLEIICIYISLALLFLFYVWTEKNRSICSAQLVSLALFTFCTANFANIFAANGNYTSSFLSIQMRNPKNEEKSSGEKEDDGSSVELRIHRKFKCISF